MLWNLWFCSCWNTKRCEIVFSARFSKNFCFHSLSFSPWKVRQFFFFPQQHKLNWFSVCLKCFPLFSFQPSWNVLSLLPFSLCVVLFHRFWSQKGLQRFCCAYSIKHTKSKRWNLKNKIKMFQEEKKCIPLDLSFLFVFFLHDCNFLDCWTKMTASIKDKIQTSFNFHPTTSTKSQLSSVIYHQRDFSTFAFHLLMALYTYMLVRCSPLCALHIIWKSKKLTAMCAFVHAKRTFESVCTYKQQQSFCGSFSLSLFLLLLYRFNAAFLCYVCWWRTSSAR